MKRLIAFILVMIMAVSSASAEIFVDQLKPEDWQQRDIMRLTFFAAGRTDCMMLEYGGEAMMIDGGNAQYAKRLIKTVREMGITHFKMIFNTHPHNDHVQGLYKMIEAGITADEFVSPFKKEYKDSYQKKTIRVLNQAGIPYRQVFHGDVLQFGKVQLHLYRWDELRTMNGMSGMLNIHFGDCRVMLCSDITGKTEQFFLNTVPAEELKTDIIKAPHHGITGLDDEYVKVTDPHLIIATIPVKQGKHMRIQAEGFGIPCLFSGDGRVVLETDGTDWYVTQEMGVF